MKSVGQLLLGLLTAVGSIVLVIAAASLSIVEGTANNPVAAVTSQPTQPVRTLEQIVTDLPEPTSPASSPTATATAVQPTVCPAPEGWVQYLITTGDTLESLASQSGATAEMIRQANCLTVSSLFPNTILYLPLKVTATVIAPATPTPLPTVAPTVAPTVGPTVAPTFAPTACTPPSNWEIYIVQPGDTLFRIGLSVGMTTDVLRNANCLTSDQIYSGQRLYLPFIPGRTSTPIYTATRPPATNTPGPTRTRTATRPTATPVTPTAIYTPTVTPSPVVWNTPITTPIPPPVDTPSSPTEPAEPESELDVNTGTPNP